jgi:hypothetical protein
MKTNRLKLPEAKLSWQRTQRYLHRLRKAQFLANLSQATNCYESYLLAERPSTITSKRGRFPAFVPAAGSFYSTIKA